MAQIASGDIHEGASWFYFSSAARMAGVMSTTALASA
jgi:hypothetical protein